MSIILIDDKLDEISSVVELLQTLAIEVNALEPDDVAVGDLERADLILVDWALDAWPRANDSSQPPAARPQDGLALAEVLRSHLGPEHSGRPTAFALHSGALDRLGRGIPGEIREHALARIHNLEWVFAKGDTAVLVPRFVALAEALRELPHPWPSPPAEGQSELMRLLALEVGDNLSWQGVADCHPPLHELATNSNGLTVLRWFAQRILPYPCFLIGDLYLATRLGITNESLAHERDADGELAQALEPCLYGGILPEFAGRRWWRSKIEDVLWEISEGQSASPRRVRDVVTKLAPDAQLLPTTNPVVCVDADYHPTEVADVDEAVRISLDDWPPYAGDPWATIELARDDEAIAVRVVPEDRDRLRTS